MAVDTVARFVDLLRNPALLTSEQLAEAAGPLGAHFPEPRALAGELVRRGWLTPFQINRLFQGRGASLALGSYVLLERLGEGGMGEVFKARHQKLGRVVALKLIRAQRLDNPDAIRRFRREIQAAAQLDHPHIVRAFDADEVHGAHLLVMEFVEGVDLAKVVKRQGPLPVARACDYARQAALGLQHAHERGLVHRDVKPANLLLTLQGTVKILDMGLARVNHPEADGYSHSTMTGEGTVMGTPDYIAPEQALEAHGVDTRADLYSLGCTLYYLLSGRPPFPTGTLLQKLNKHQFEEPTPVEQLRPDVPPAVAGVLRKLMAKRPDDRCQTPAEAAAALEAAVAAPPPSQDDGDTVDTAADIPHRAAERRRQQAARGRRRLALYVVAALLSLGLGGLLLMLFLRLAFPPPVAPPAPPPQTTATFEDWLQRMAALPADEQVKAVANELKKRNPNFDGTVKPTVENGVVVGLEFVTDEVTDVAPVRALAGLRTLKCAGSWGNGRLADLSPLKDMKLTHLTCEWAKVSDLSPLKETKLSYLNCAHTLVSDLAPLRPMTLTTLYCGDTPVVDLSPLKDMKLTTLSCAGTRVSDLAPLIGL